MSKYIIRLRRRSLASPKRGMKSAWDEWQVVEGRRVVSRHDSERQAQDWIVQQRQPLPPGAIIEYCGEHGEVISDPGGNGRVTVRVGDHQAQWWWTFEGVTCSVVSIPSVAGQVSHLG